MGVVPAPVLVLVVVTPVRRVLRGCGAPAGCLSAGASGAGVRQPQQPPPQQPPPPPPPLGAGAGEDFVPPTATVDSSFTVSSWPAGQLAGSAERAIGRLTSKVSPQLRQRYS